MRSINGLRLLERWLAAIYPAERWDAFHDAIEPPTRGNAAPSVVGASAYAVQTSSGNARWLVRAEIADVPDRGRSDWGIDLAPCFADAVHENANGDVRLQRLTFSGRSGSLAVELDPDVDAGAVAAAISRAVKLADERYEDRRTRQADVNYERRKRAAQWQPLWRTSPPVY